MEKMVLPRVLVLVLLMLALPVQGHGIHHQQGVEEAVVVTLEYADGNPFAFKRYRIRAEGSDGPVQTGRTDARGRVVFLPEGEGPWTVRAEAQSGHGHTVTVEAAPEGAVTSRPASTARGPEYVVLGLGILLALFGGWALYRNRRG